LAAIPHRRNRVFLTRFALQKVYLIHRRISCARPKNEAIVCREPKSRANLEQQCDQILSRRKREMRAVRLRNVQTNEEREAAGRMRLRCHGHESKYESIREDLKVIPTVKPDRATHAESKAFRAVFIAGDVAGSRLQASR